MANQTELTPLLESTGVSLGTKHNLLKRTLYEPISGTFRSFRIVGRCKYTMPEKIKSIKRDFKAIDILEKLTTVPNKYGVVQVTDEGVYKSLEQYNVQREVKYNVTYLDQAFHMLENMLSKVRRFDIKSPAQVEINNDGVCGIPFVLFYNKKGVAYHNHYEDIYDYCKSPYGIDVLWTSMGKSNEILPVLKVVNGECRTLIYPPLHFLVLQGMFFDDLDDLLKSGWFWSAYGFNPYSGGYDELYRMLENFKYKHKGDIKKMDRSLETHLTLRAYRLRRRVSTHPEDPRWDYIIDKMANKMVVLPNGLIFVTPRVASGSRDTTSTNTLVHMGAQLYHIIRMYNKVGCPVYISFIRRNNFAKDYSDDHVAASNHKFISSYVHRRKSYAQLGLELKAEEDLVIEEMETEFGFLGGLPIKINGHYYPLYNGDKIIDSLTYDLSNLNTEEKYQQLCMYMQLTCASEKLYSLLSNFCTLYFDRQPPPRPQLLRAWLNLESCRVVF